MNSGSCKNVIYKLCLLIIYNMYGKDLTLNNLHWLICHKPQNNLLLLLIFSSSFSEENIEY